MKRSILTLAAIAFFALATGCGSEAAPAGASVTADAAAQVPGSNLDELLGNVDLGHDPEGTRAGLEAALVSPNLSSADKARAKLGLSVVYETLGDTEHAIQLAEELVATDDSSRAQKRLRFLLTGHETDAASTVRRQERIVAPFARALEAYYPPLGSPKIVVDTVILGGNETASAKLGTFAVGDSLLEHADARCPSCEEMRTGVDSQSSRESSWIAIPRYSKRMASALVVIYVDLETLVPARYEGFLPMPTAEIEARLRQGQAFALARERNGAPPVILIAAPRHAQLEDVETKLASMTTVPLEPAFVPVSDALKPSEIQAVVRGDFGRFHTCYDHVIAVSPKAGGEAKMSFSIEADGSVSNARVVVDRALDIEGMGACMLAGLQKLVFPATTPTPKGPTTVVYPITFSSDAK